MESLSISLTLLIAKFLGAHAVTDPLQTPIIVEGRRNFVLVPTGEVVNSFQQWQGVNNGELVTDQYLHYDPERNTWNLDQQKPSDNPIDRYGELSKFYGRTMPIHRGRGAAWKTSQRQYYTEPLRLFHSQGETRTKCFPQPGSFPSTNRQQVTGSFVGLIDCAEAAFKQFTDPQPSGVEREPVFLLTEYVKCWAYFGKASDLKTSTALTGPFACAFKVFLLPGNSVGNESTFNRTSVGPRDSAAECANIVETTQTSANGMSWNAITQECLAIVSMEGVEPLHGGTSPWLSAFVGNTTASSTSTSTSSTSTATRSTSTSTSSTSTSTSSTSTSTSSTSTTTPNTTGKVKRGVIVGAVVGAVGGLAVLAGLGVAAIYYWGGAGDRAAPEEDDFVG